MTLGSSALPAISRHGTGWTQVPEQGAVAVDLPTSRPFTQSQPAQSCSKLAGPPTGNSEATARQLLVLQVRLPNQFRRTQDLLPLLRPPWPRPEFGAVERAQPAGPQPGRPKAGSCAGAAGSTAIAAVVPDASGWRLGPRGRHVRSEFVFLHPARGRSASGRLCGRCSDHTGPIRPYRD